MLRGGLLEEQLARPARQTQHVDRPINGERRGLLELLNLEQETILIPTKSGRMLVEKFLGDAPVELVHVHRLDTRFDLVVPDLQFLDGLRVGRLLGLVRHEHSVAEPCEDRLRDDQLPEDAGELASEDFLARVWFGTFSPVSGAVVVHVLSLFQLANKHAAAVATVNQAGVGEVVLHFADLVLGARIQ